VSLWIAPRFSFTTNALVFGFKGRIPRSVFWLMTAIQLVYFLSIYAQLMHISPSGFLGARIQPLPQRITWVLAGHALLLGLWSVWAVSGKRWHDFNRSSLFNILLAVPVLGLLCQIVLGALPGTQGTNRYGDDPIAGSRDRNLPVWDGPAVT
jgi:uncharacterized membrane protein YhaH (DUF805 family)